MNLSKNKVLAGVIGLIAVVGIANTQAIVSLTNYVKGSNEKVVFSSEGQEAQVSLASSKCVQVLPPSDNRTSFIDPFIQGVFSSHEYLVGFKIRNRCNYNISIIRDDTSDLNDIVFIQDFPNLNHPSNIIINHFYGPQPVAPASITAQGTSSMIPFTLTQGSYSIYETQIQPGNERDFMFIGRVNTDGMSLESHIRISLNKFRWFKTSDFSSDNMLSNNEIKTFIFPNKSSSGPDNA